MPELPEIKTKKDFEIYFQAEFWLDVAKEICRREQFSYDEIKRLDSSDHVVYSLDDRFILKIYRPFRNCFEREIKALEFVGGKINFKTPEIVKTGEFENFPYALITQISGAAMTRADWLKLPETAQIPFVQKLAHGLKQIHALPAETFANDWAQFVKNRAETFVERQIAHGVNDKILAALPTFIDENLSLIPVNPPSVLMHADVHFGNLRVSENLEIAGLFDFADSRKGFHEYEFLAVGLLMIQGQTKLQREFFKAYGYAENDLDETMRRRLMMLTMLYETADLRRYALRLKPEAVDFSLEELERGIWSFAD